MVAIALQTGACKNKYNLLTYNTTNNLLSEQSKYLMQHVQQNWNAIKYINK